MYNEESPAIKLKNEGNALFAKKDYEAARHKYTQALKLDENNAVLYANRAACNQFLRKFLDAVGDAKKATDLDPNYAKAWARLATAQSLLANNEGSIASWKKAIEVLPEANLSAAEKKQKEQYEAELKTIEKKLRKLETTPVQGFSSSRETAPWKRARAVVTERLLSPNHPDGLLSSAFLITGAWDEWEGAMEKMGMQRPMGNSPQGPLMMGSTGAIEGFSNAILRDERIFHLTNNNFISKYNMQVKIEAQMLGAWVEGGPQQIIPDVIKRLRLHGRDACRRAITSTIRLWIMRGFMESTIRSNGAVGAEFIGRALEMLRWGIREWADIPQDDRGAIFSDSFVYGVHALYIETYMKACSSNPKKFSLDTLLKEAQDLLDTDMPSVYGGDPGFQFAFTVYPRATAFSQVGFYHSRTAENMVAAKSEDRAAIYRHYDEAARAYESAADLLPKDDEKHIWFLNCALMNFFSSGRSLRTTMPIMEKIKERLPGSNRIWEKAALTQEARPMIKRTLEFEEDCRDGLAKGKITMDSTVLPDFLQSRLPSGATSDVNGKPFLR